MAGFGLASIAFGGGAPTGAMIVEGQALALADLDREGRLAQASPLELLDRWDEAFPLLEGLVDAGRFQTAPSIETLDVRAPYSPRQVFCAGANYRKHVVSLIMGDPSMRPGAGEAMTDAERLARAEQRMDERAKDALPYVFIKLPSCVVGPRDAVQLPRNVQKPDWELELAVVIGKRARHVAAADAMSCVAGFAIVNDVTARDHVFRRDQTALGADWLSGKCFPTFLPFGPMIVPRQFIDDPYDLNIKLSVNGKVYQNETTADMLISIEKQIEYLSDRVVLQPGDLICTGSPYGNGSAFGIWLKDGDVMDGAISGLGAQRNLCLAEAA